jgi:hypothetical protein
VQIINLILSIVAIIGVAIIGLSLKFFLPSYFKKKAEFLATKEDIGEITKRVKEVEIMYCADLARLNAKLATASHVNSKQFELELLTYKLIWESLVKVRAAFLLHRGLARTNRQESVDDNDNANYAILLEALRSLNEVVENQRPFYSPNIWKSIKSLADLITFEGNMDVGNRSLIVALPDIKDKNNFREQKIAKSKEINDAIDGVCEAIRHRIFELGNP